MGSRSVARVVALSVWAYRLLLWTYPATFRRRYGADMARVFRDLCRDTHRRAGAGGVLRLWPAALGDLAAGALGEFLVLLASRGGTPEGERLALAAVGDGLSPRRTGAGGVAVRYGMLAGIVVALGQVTYGLLVLHGRGGLDATSAMGGLLIGLELLLYGAAATRVAAVARPDLRLGSLCGLAGGALWLLYTLLADLVALDGATYQALSWGTIGGLCLLYMAAGLLGARAAGTWAGGIRGGMWASLVAQLACVIALFLVQDVFAGLAARASLADPDYLRSGLRDVTVWNIQDALGGAFYTLLLAPLCGAALGGVGALLWKGRARCG